MSAAELKKLQQMESLPLAIARESVLTGVEPNQLLVETSVLELKSLLNLLPRMEVRGGLLRIKRSRGPLNQMAGGVSKNTERASTMGGLQTRPYRHRQDNQKSSGRLVLARYDNKHPTTSERV